MELGTVGGKITKEMLNERGLVIVRKRRGEKPDPSFVS